MSTFHGRYRDISSVDNILRPTATQPLHTHTSPIDVFPSRTDEQLPLTSVVELRHEQAALPARLMNDCTIDYRLIHLSTPIFLQPLARCATVSFPVSTMEGYSAEQSRHVAHNWHVVVALWWQ
jgi:hypothetical protein